MLHKMIAVIDAQSPNVSQEMKKEFRNLWEIMEFGNDYYYMLVDVIDIEGGEGAIADMPLTAKYCREQGLTEVLLHYWW